MESILTKYGLLRGAVNKAAHPDGSPRDVRLLAENRLNTNYGELIPRHDLPGDARLRFGTDLMFYGNGDLRYIAFKSRTHISTRYGDFPCISAMFYEGGGLKHLFMEDMDDVCGMGEAMELELADKQRILLDFGIVDARIAGITFHAGGAIESVTFVPDETAVLDTPNGSVKLKHGMTFHENGSVRALEPAEPLLVDTPIGELIAFDAEADASRKLSHSLEFFPDGEVKSLTSVTNIITATNGKDEMVFKPCSHINSYFNELTEYYPFRLSFINGMVIIKNNETHILKLDDYCFEVYAAN